jgi:hypothetical protein
MLAWRITRGDRIMPPSKILNLLQIASGAVAVFGLATAAAAFAGTNGFVALFTDIVFWPLDGAQSVATPEARFLSGVLGGITTGWGVMLWLTSRMLFPKDPALARQIILSSVFTWFVVDSTASVISGAALNVAPNLVFLVMFWLPLSR